MELSQKQLKNLLKTLEDGGVSEFEYQDDRYRVRVVRGGAGASPAGTALGPSHAAGASASASAAAPGDAEDANVVYVTSPFVGTFYRSPSPEASPFVEVGSTVTAGQPLCIVEAMKLMNEIESEQAGVVLEILVDNATSVEYGQKLFKLGKS
ncbi:MAG TPA: acetyl-CoA carboxylase biotin carboxyl carrier protein [Polyangiaceae bacterium]|jgi:acetyl-CoA carboxylase biotin carboxyl carrier protein